jgi:endonuclease YncB( thermonuclease family)
MVAYGPYPAVVTKVHDGDTITLRIKYGFNTLGEWECRLYGDNSREIGTPEGKADLAYMVNNLLKIGDSVTTVSHSWDKFGGRYDGDIFLSDGRSLVAEMIAAGHALPWDGKGPKPV